MAKLNSQDLASVLIDKYGLERETALLFVTRIFDIVQKGIERDKLVKIKGLGTFKVIDVESRESVNVNTGERVVIESHAKITFTPDAAMRELVNKPFSGFETVLLNDGVTFDDVDTPEPDPDMESDEKPVVNSPILDFVDDSEVISEEPHDNSSSLADAPMSDEVPVSDESPVEKETPDVEDPSLVDESPITEEATEEFDQEKTCHSLWWIWILLVLLVGALCFATGHFLGQLGVEMPWQSWYQQIKPQSDVVMKVEQDTTLNKKDSLLLVSNNSVDTIQKDSLAKDTLKKESQHIEGRNADKLDSSIEDYQRYEEKDARVRTGAYRIVGTAQVVKAKQGDTLERISRRILGEGMACYLEVFNDLQSSTPLTVGQEIKIPKLELKKKRNNR